LLLLEVVTVVVASRDFWEASNPTAALLAAAAV
jgi:hypothetical protein